MAYLRKNPETPMQNNAADGMVEKLKAYAAGKPAAPAQKLEKATPAWKPGAATMNNDAAGNKTEKLKTYYDTAQKLEKATPAVKTGAVEAAKPKKGYLTTSTAQDDNDMAQAFKTQYDAARKATGSSTMKNNSADAAALAKYAKAKKGALKPAGASDTAAQMANALREKANWKEQMTEALRKTNTLQNATGQMKSKAVDDDITAALQRAMRKRRPQ